MNTTLNISIKLLIQLINTKKTFLIYSIDEKTNTITDYIITNDMTRYFRKQHHHFKLIDETECYQNEYNDLVLTNGNDANSSDNTNSSDNANDILFASNISEKKVISMDDFVTRKNVRQSNKKNHFPKQKIANVKEKKYRTKGIKKNKSNPIINNEKGIV